MTDVPAAGADDESMNCESALDGTTAEAAAATVFPGDSEMAHRCRAFDWAATPLGPVAGWPERLRTMAALVVAARQPMLLWWGPELVQLYNDGFRSSLGADRHAAALGARGREFWVDAWPVIGPDVEGVLAGGPAVWHEDRLVPIERDGRLANVYWTYGYTPIAGDADVDGARMEGASVRGVLVTVLETTGRVQAQHAAELAASNAQLQDQQVELELSNEQLQAQAGELEVQAEELRATAARLAEQTEAADRAVAALRASEERYVLAARATSNAIWDWDLVTHEVRWNPGIHEVLGHPPGTVEETSAWWYAHIHPDDRERVVSGIHRVIDDPAGGSAWRDEYRFQVGALRRGADAGADAGADTGDAYALVADRGYVARGAAGEPLRMIGAMEDVTAARTAEAARAASVARYRALVTSLDIGFCVIEVLFDERGDAVDYRYLETNATFERQSGLVGAVGRRIREYAPDLEAHWPETFGRVAATGEPARVESQVAALGRWFDVFAFRVDDPAQRRVAVLFTDVSAAKVALRERERLVAALEVERNRLRQAFDQAPGFVAMLRGPEHRFEYANGPYAQISAHRPLLGRTVREAFPELVGQGFYELLDRVYATGEAFVGTALPIQLQPLPGGPVELRRIDLIYQPLTEAADDPDGGDAPDDAPDAVQGHASQERASRMRVAGILVQGRDVTEATAAQEAADLAHRRLEAVLEQLPVGVHIAEAPSGRLVLGNATVRRIWGGAPASASAADYSPDYVAYHRDAPRDGRPYASHEWPLARALATGAVVLDEVVEAERPDGTRRLVSLSAAPVRDAEGRVVGGVAVSVDVTDRERLLAESEAARLDAEAARAIAEVARAAAEQERARAEEANRAKGAFLANMSHELRTPLNAIGGYAELLELGIRGPVTEQQRADLARIQASQRHLLGLVDEVLDLAKIDAGAAAVARVAMAADATADSALVLVRPQAAAKGLDLTEACTTAAGMRYVGDEPRVRQILVNLLGNAIKFTPAGGRVELACAITEVRPAEARLAGTPAGPYITLRVEDTGVGIAPDQHERVFEPFTQAEVGSSPYTRAAGGTGLGLAISRRLARLMDGDITLESTPGAGSTFTLWLPAVERRARPRATSAAGGADRAARAASGAVTGDDVPRQTVAPQDGSPGDDATGRAFLAAVGAALVDGAGAHARAWRARVADDPALPHATPDGRPFTVAELEDHMAAMIADIGLTLRTLAEPHDEPALARDGTAILGVIAERHGAQRARLGWPAAAVAREFALLGEVVAAAIPRPVTSSTVEADRARAVLAELLAYAERASQGGLRVAAPAAASHGGGGADA